MFAKPQPSRPIRWLNTLGRWYLRIASAVLGTALLLAMVDPLVGRLTEPFSRDLKSIPYYAGQEWTDQFIRDQDQIGSSRTRYVPFTVWRRPAYQSQTVNVDQAGERVVPGASQDAMALRIWFFGGSTMWGTSSPDWGTIPAQFQRLAEEELERPLAVRNLGESAWVSTQSVIALIQELQHGRVPDSVIFYEGANDLTWAFGNSQPYRHAEFQRIASKFNRSGRGRGDIGEVSRSWEDLLGFVAPRLGIAWQRARFNSGWPQDDTPAGLDRLAREAVQVCLHNQRIVESLGREYGFDVHSFWQPYLIYDRKPLAPGEEAILNQSPRWVQSFRPFAQAANAELARGGKDRFHDLSDCFSQVQNQLFTDMVHVTPEGNELVARAMLDKVGSGLRNRRQPVPLAEPAAETGP